MNLQSSLRYLARQAIKYAREGDIKAASALKRLVTTTLKTSNAKLSYYSCKRANDSGWLDSLTPEQRDKLDAVRKELEIKKPTNTEAVEKTIKAYDPELHAKLYANREDEWAALVGGLFFPSVARKAHKVVGEPVTLGTNFSLAGLAGMNKFILNNDDVMTQTALKWLLLKNEYAATKLKAIMEREGRRKIDQNAARLIQKELHGYDPLMFPDITPEEDYKFTATKNYGDAVLSTIKKQPNALTPELGTISGQTGSVLASVLPQLLPQSKVVLPATSLGLFSTRSALTGLTAHNRLDELFNESLAPNQPDMGKYMFNGLAANVDEKFISGIPVRHWSAYLAQKDKNNGVAFRIPPDKTYQQKVQEVMPFGVTVPDTVQPIGYEAEGTPVYKTPLGYVKGKAGVPPLLPPIIPSSPPISPMLSHLLGQKYEFDKAFMSEIRAKSSKGFQAMKNTLSSGVDVLSNAADKVNPPPKDLDYFKLRAKYPSFGSK